MRVWTGAALLSAAAIGGSATQSPAGSYHEKITGTLVSFEMVHVPDADFFIGRTEVTWDLFDVYMLRLDMIQTGTSAADAVARPSEPYGAPDYGWGHAGFPAMSVTQASAIAFCQWLSAKTGRTYRLPTDAEWSRAASYAAHGAEARRLTDVAWYEANSDGRVHAVARRPADARGLFDLFGNVAEWVTMPDGSLVTRGGSYRDPVKSIGPEARAVQDATWNQRDPQLPKSKWWLSDGPFVGFRVVSPVR
jgi:formylglycine-generating enzyme required for sulfatase activity